MGKSWPSYTPSTDVLLSVMDLIPFIVIAVILGLIVWAIYAYLPIPLIFKKIILFACVAVLVLMLLSAMGLLNFHVAIPKVR